MNAYPDFDLNLLRALDALLHERNVTRAASRIGLTQPAMSRALARLRTVFDDPLLVRAGRGMELTPRAIDVREPVRRILEGVHDTVAAGGAFDPATAQRTATIATTDYCEALLLPALVTSLAARAPGVDLVVQRGSRNFGDLVESRELDFAIGPPTNAAGSLSTRRLFAEQFSCIVRKGHPAVGARLSLQRFAALSHLLIAPGERAGGVVDDVLAERGLRRRVALRVPSFLVAPQVVAGTDLIATMPRRLARQFARSLPLRVLAPPVPIPGFSIAMFWHPRNDRDPAHAWLRQQIVAVAAPGGRASPDPDVPSGR